MLQVTFRMLSLFTALAAIVIGLVANMLFGLLLLLLAMFLWMISNSAEPFQVDEEKAREAGRLAGQQAKHGDPMAAKLSQSMAKQNQGEEAPK